MYYKFLPSLPWKRSFGGRLELKYPFKKRNYEKSDQPKSTMKHCKLRLIHGEYGCKNLPTPLLAMSNPCSEGSKWYWNRNGFGWHVVRASNAFSSIVRSVGDFSGKWNYKISLLWNFISTNNTLDYLCEQVPALFVTVVFDPNSAFEWNSFVSLPKFVLYPCWCGPGGNSRRC